MVGKLTKRKIDSLVYRGAPPRGRHIVWDTEIHRFGVRLHPSGKKVFVLAYGVDGRDHLMTLGHCSAITLEQARGEAQQQLSNVLQDDDPLEARAIQRRGVTMRHLCVHYIEHHAKLHKKSWKKDERRLVRHALPRFANHKAKSIKRGDIAVLHRQVGERHGRYEANRLLEVLSKMFDLAATWGFVDGEAPNPARRIPKFHEQARDRWVSPEELPELAKAIDNEKNVYARYALWLYLLTGLRKNELLAVKRSDIDWSRKELRLGDTKSGRPHYLPLSAQALAFMRQAPEVSGNPFLFPGLRGNGHLVNIDKAWRRVRAAAGISDVHLHDLRRTVGSWLAQSGNSLHLVARVLNQTTPATTATYARFAQDQVRDALEAHAVKIMGVAAGRRADVVRLKR